VKKRLYDGRSSVYRTKTSEVVKICFFLFTLSSGFDIGTGGGKTEITSDERLFIQNDTESSSFSGLRPFDKYFALMIIFNYSFCK